MISQEGYPIDEEVHDNHLSHSDRVRGFRRDCRGLLKWALVQLFKRALRARLGDFMLPAGLKRRLVDAAVMRLDLARQMDRGYDGL